MNLLMTLRVHEMRLLEISWVLDLFLMVTSAGKDVPHTVLEA